MRKKSKIILFTTGGLFAILALLLIKNYQADIPVEQLKEKYANNSSRFIILILGEKPSPSGEDFSKFVRWKHTEMGVTRFMI